METENSGATMDIHTLARVIREVDRIIDVMYLTDNKGALLELVELKRLLVLWQNQADYLSHADFTCLNTEQGDV